MRRFVAVLAVVSGSCGGGSGSETASSADSGWEIAFTPDSGIRVELAAEPAARVDESGQVLLFYRDKSSESGATLLAISGDGLTFAAGLSSDRVRYPYDTQLPDGRWRRYWFDSAAGAVKSLSSTDGSTWTADEGVRYSLTSSDNGSMGIYDAFPDSAGGVTLLYLGDLYGLNNVRRAYSTDGGETFTFTNGNVLGDDGAGGGGRSYVDQHSYPLPDGRRRMTCMKQGALPPQPGARTVGEIHSFVSSDEGKTWTYEAKLFDANSFGEFTVWSLNDPTMIRLGDGRYRIYVAALISDGAGGYKWVLLSATSERARS